MSTNETNFLSFIAIVSLCFFAIGCGSGAGNISDNTDKRITEERIDGNNDGIIDYTIEYSYDSLGQLSKKAYDFEEGYPSTTRYLFYDSDGYLVEEILEDENGRELQHSFYFYDDSCTTNKINLPTGHTHGTSVEYIFCDEDGNKILSKYDSNEDDIIDSYEEYEIDEFGNRIAKRHYSPDGTEIVSLYQSYVNEYDDNGLLISQIVYSEDTIFYQSTYEYDDENYISTWTMDRYSGGEYDSTGIFYYIYD
jgi:hypothetical protein